MSLAAALGFGVSLMVPLPIALYPDLISTTQMAQIQAALPPERLTAAGAGGDVSTVAILRGIDKITARPTRLIAPVNDPTIFGTLKITVRYCRQRPPEEPPETFVFLDVVDQGIDGMSAPRRIFSGWMFASSPAISALDHPVYDVSVINCTTSAPEISEGTERKSP